MDPGSKSALEYSRDAQAPVLHAIEGVMLIIREDVFDPDVSRARRWKLPHVRSLHDAMAYLARRGPEPQISFSDEYEPESPVGDVWTLVGSDGDVSLSSFGESCNELFEHECQTSDEDRDAEFSAPIVGASMSSDLHYSIGEVDIFKHVKSGCCHVAKQSQVDEDDGDPVILRCGKVATRNFEKVTDVANFMPYKCTRSRCFSSGLE